MENVKLPDYLYPYTRDSYEQLVVSRESAICKRVTKVGKRQTCNETGWSYGVVDNICKKHGVDDIVSVGRPRKINTINVDHKDKDLPYSDHESAYSIPTKDIGHESQGKEGLSHSDHYVQNRDGESCHTDRQSGKVPRSSENFDHVDLPENFQIDNSTTSTELRLKREAN